MKIKSKINAYKIVFINRVRGLRAQRGLSQVELARKAGVSQATVAHIEKGKKFPSFETMVRLADALEVNPYHLVTPSTEDCLR